MTAVNTTIHTYNSCRRRSFGYPHCHYQKNPDTSDNCLFFLLAFFFAMVIFSAHGYGFSVRAIPKQRLLREGWDGERTKSKNGFPKSPAGGGFLVFTHKNASRRFWEGRDGNNATACRFFLYFILFTVQHMGSP